MKEFFARRWFLTCLLCFLTLGMRYPASFQSLLAIDSDLAAAAVIFVMALPLQGNAIHSAITRPLAVFVALLVNIVALPLAAWWTSRLLGPSMGQGLVIAACIPSTLASSAVLTRRAGGNEAVAILVMMISNLTCFAYTPVLLALLAGQRITSQESTQSMVLNLAAIVVAPVALAQGLQRFRPIGLWAVAHRRMLGLAAQAGLLCMIFKAAVITGMQLQAQEQILQGADWLKMGAAVCGLHLSALVLGYQCVRLGGGRREEAVGAGFSGSQKTLMVGLALATKYFPEAMILPVVAYHCCQLVLDTVIADWWGSARERSS